VVVVAVEDWDRSIVVGRLMNDEICKQGVYNE